MRAYEVAVRFYAEVAPMVDSRLPGLLYAALDPVAALRGSCWEGPDLEARCCWIDRSSPQGDEFTPGRPEPVMVDFQTVSGGTGAYDLAYFVGGYLQPALRRWSPAAGCPRESFGGLLMAVCASMLANRRSERTACS